MSSGKWRFRIEDMLNAARKIVAYVEGLTFEDFARDEKTFDAVLRRLTLLGAAATHVPEEIVSRTSDIPWFEMRGSSMRFGRVRKVIHERQQDGTARAGSAGYR
ncbi:MAG: DUF86 domain-containing protein [Desulfacinum sp.]|jgi:uncharacterized protein with HEPN domain|nr:DUF86 domain-containing protein [Desulfacinum sp.]